MILSLFVEKDVKVVSGLIVDDHGESFYVQITSKKEGMITLHFTSEVAAWAVYREIGQAMHSRKISDKRTGIVPEPNCEWANEPRLG